MLAWELLRSASTPQPRRCEQENPPMASRNQANKASRSQEPTQASQPGREDAMQRKPVFIREDYRGSGRLQGRRAYITGGDSGIGRAVAIHFAREGADVAIVYLDEDTDAEQTRALVEAEGRRCHLVSADLAEAAACRAALEEAVGSLGGLDILVNNIAEQHTVESAEELDPQQIEDTFRTNVFSYFNTVAAALEHMDEGGVILNTSSITGSRGHTSLLDYSATKGAVNAMTAALAKSLQQRRIRVNAIAPGPVWTPLIPASFDAEEVAEFGRDTPMGRPAEPSEIAPAYVFLACDDGSYINGVVLHINGGSHIDV
jgi:NAD(P)-dependent dehydrogenase (short-subunit alcohol dehydrogenase family)